MKFFLPKQQNFFDLLSQLSKYTQDIAQLFQEAAPSLENIREHAKQAKDIEHAADEKTHAIIDQLNRTFITPFDREDIYLLAKELDDSIDLIENVISNLEVYQLTEPLQNTLPEFGKIMKEASEKVYDLISHLQSNKKNQQYQETIIYIHRLEDKGDKLFKEAIQHLFSTVHDPILVMKWKDIYEDLENVMDKFQQISDTIESIVVKSQ